MTEIAQKAGFQTNEQKIEVKFVPESEDLKKCVEFGQQIEPKSKPNLSILLERNKWQQKARMLPFLNYA